MLPPEWASLSVKCVLNDRAYRLKSQVGALVLVVPVMLGGPTDGPVTEEDDGRAVRLGPVAAISSPTT